ncbi:uncharacterized protein LOC125516205 [Triticum urartu]|uniref:uncharacterized protein LOC125516205 n=1 Tax=Triticum urartu TaxID=4572 RepID=UPI00204315FE|nr:uncharacterized protein LOC125516205 [Triticum urartu]
MVSIADELAAAGKAMDEDDIVDHILQGLLHEPDYSGFVSAISTRTATEQPIRLGELFSLLPLKLASRHRTPPTTPATLPTLLPEAEDAAATPIVGAMAAAATTTTRRHATPTTPVAMALEGDHVKGAVIAVTVNGARSVSLTGMARGAIKSATTGTTPTTSAILQAAEAATEVATMVEITRQMWFTPMGWIRIGISTLARLIT